MLLFHIIVKKATLKCNYEKLHIIFRPVLYRRHFTESVIHLNGIIYIDTLLNYYFRYIFLI